MLRGTSTEVVCQWVRHGRQKAWVQGRWRVGGVDRQMGQGSATTFCVVGGMGMVLDAGFVCGMGVLPDGGVDGGVSGISSATASEVAVPARSSTAFFFRRFSSRSRKRKAAFDFNSGCPPTTT